MSARGSALAALTEEAAVAVDMVGEDRSKLGSFKTQRATLALPCEG
jgi:hypothetical protein